MLKEFKDKFINDKIQHFNEKCSIISTYHSKDGDILETANGAYTQIITVVYDIVSISNTTKSETSMISSNNEISQFSKITDTFHIDNVSSIIESVITSKLTSVILSIVGPTDSINLSDSLLLKMFNYFNNITIKQNENVANKIILPDGDFKLSSFNVSGGTLIIPNNFIMTVNNNLEISSTIIKCNVSDSPSFQVVGKTVVLDNLSFTQPIKLITGSSYQKSSDDFAETSVKLSRLNFSLLGFDDRDNSEIKKIYKDPLISIESNNYTEIFDVNLYGGSFRKFIILSGVKSVTVDYLLRTSKSINAYTIGLDSVRSFKLSNVDAYGEVLSETKANLIEFDTSSTTILDTVTLTDLVLRNYGLSNIDNLNIKTFYINNCNFDGETFLSTKNCNVNRLTISSSRIDSSDGFNIEGNDIEFLESNIISEKNNFTVYSKNNIRINKSSITCDNKDLILKLENDSKIFIKDSNILANNFNVVKNDKDDSQLIRALEDTVIKTIKISNSNFKLGGIFFIFDIDNQIYDGIKFTNVSEIELSGATSLSAPVFALNVDKIVPIKFKSNTFKNMNFVSDTSPSKFIYNISNCSGNINHFVKDVNTEKRQFCNVDINCDNSKVHFFIGSEKFKVIAKVNTSSSLGSSFFGGNNVTVTPSLLSTDIEEFERIDDPTVKKYNKVCYGNN